MQLEPHRYRGRLLAIIALTAVLGLSLAFEVDTKPPISGHDHHLTLSGRTAFRANAPTRQ